MYLRFCDLGLGEPFFFASFFLPTPVSAQVRGSKLGGFVLVLCGALVCRCIFAPPSPLLTRASTLFLC